MKKETAQDLAFVCYRENQPIDWKWVNYVNRNRTRKEKIEWARGMIEPFAYGCSENKITRAAKFLLTYLNLD